MYNIKQIPGCVLLLPLAGFSFAALEMSLYSKNHGFQCYISWHDHTRKSKAAGRWGGVRDRWFHGNNWGLFCNLAPCRVMILRILLCKVRMKSAVWCVAALNEFFTSMSEFWHWRKQIPCRNHFIFPLYWEKFFRAVYSKQVISFPVLQINQNSQRSKLFLLINE